MWDLFFACHFVDGVSVDAENACELLDGKWFLVHVFSLLFGSFTTIIVCLGQKGSFSVEFVILEGGVLDYYGSGMLVWRGLSV